MKNARNFGLIAVVALVLSLPGGSSVLNVVLTTLLIAFFTAIALFGYRLFKEHSFTIESLSERQRLVLYVSVALAFFTFTAAQRLFNAGGLGVLLWLAMLGACSYGVFWVYTQARDYG